MELLTERRQGIPAGMEREGYWRTWIQGSSEKSVISLTEWQNDQGGSAMDGRTRSPAAGTPLDSDPNSFKAALSIPLGKSDFEDSPESMYANTPPVPCQPEYPAFALSKYPEICTV